MRGIAVMTGMLVLVSGLHLAVQASAGETVTGRVLSGALGVISLWPLTYLLWSAIQGLRFGRAEVRVTRRLAQEVDRCSRASERLVIAIVRFPEKGLLEFPFGPSHHGVLGDLRQKFRRYDQVERVGFGTYVLILPGTDEIGAVTIRERLLEAVRREQRWRVRVGVSIHPEDGLTPEILRDHAERHCA